MMETSKTFTWEEMARRAIKAEGILSRELRMQWCDTCKKHVHTVADEKDYRIMRCVECGGDDLW